MCNHVIDQPRQTLPFEKKYRLADFFDSHWDDYVKNPAHFIKPEQYKAVNAIRLCRTDALGKDIYRCSNCNQTIAIHHSCKNRFCPTCSWSDTLKWGDKMQQMLLNIPHRHVVITLPHALNNLIKCNQKELTAALLSISAQVITDYILTTFGIKAGVIGVLHTFGEQKNFHVHVHMIVSWGGIKASTLEQVALANPYINFNDLKELFKTKYLRKIKLLYKKQNLVHRFASKEAFDKFIDSLACQKWIIHLEPPMKIPTQVITYIGRYSKRACLSEYKITKMGDEKISFRYKDYKKTNSFGKPQEKELELHYSEFFPRLLQHVPLPRFRMVRYYGIYNSSCQIVKKYRLSKQQNASVPTESTAEAILETIEAQAQEFTDTIICMHCKGQMLYIKTEIKRDTHEMISYEKQSLIARNETVHERVA